MKAIYSMADSTLNAKVKFANFTFHILVWMIDWSRMVEIIWISLLSFDIKVMNEALYAMNQNKLQLDNIWTWVGLEKMSNNATRSDYSGGNPNKNNTLEILFCLSLP